MISHQPIISAPKYPNLLVDLAQIILFLEMLKNSKFLLVLQEQVFFEGKWNLKKNDLKLFNFSKLNVQNK